MKTTIKFISDFGIGISEPLRVKKFQFRDFIRNPKVGGDSHQIRNGIVLFIFAILLMNCTGEKGAIGPQGIAGQQGAKGEKGDVGVSGIFPKTQTGTFTIKAADWIGDSRYRAVVPVTAITKEAIDKGIISVWWISSTSQQFPLPLDRNFDKITSSYYATNGGQIRIDIIYGTNLTNPPKPTGDLTFRWVINL